VPGGKFGPAPCAVPTSLSACLAKFTDPTYARTSLLRERPPVAQKDFRVLEARAIKCILSRTFNNLDRDQEQFQRPFLFD
jgi:hypothetical protein